MLYASIRLMVGNILVQLPGLFISSEFSQIISKVVNHFGYVLVRGELGKKLINLQP